jgi:hypothetical protein
MYSSSWTEHSAVFTRPGAENPAYYYELLDLTVSESGVYAIEFSSDIDSQGYLYNGLFDPVDPLSNLVMSVNGSKGNNEFYLNATLSANLTYYFVATTYNEKMTGPFMLTVFSSMAAVINLIKRT